MQRYLPTLERNMPLVASVSARALIGGGRLPGFPSMKKGTKPHLAIRSSRVSSELLHHDGDVLRGRHVEPRRHGRLGKLFEAEPPLQGAGITQRVASTHTAKLYRLPCRADA